MSSSELQINFSELPIDTENSATGQTESLDYQIAPYLASKYRDATLY